MRRICLLVVLFGAIGVPVASGLVGDKKKPNPDDPIVYVVPNGDAYHKSPKCVTLRKSKTINELGLTEAVLTAYSPCLQCSPPTREIALDKPIQITVDKLLAEPNQFDGKRVQVKGTVTEHTQVGGTSRKGKTTLVVADGEKKITVFSNFGISLKLNDQVVVTGKFSKETSKIDATPITGKVEIQSKEEEKKPEEKKIR